jgi:soluble lytic murein transglycosylase-like protein
VERLTFGVRARRPARLRRLAVAASIAWLGLALLEVPTGLELLGAPPAPSPDRGAVETSDTIGALLRFRGAAFEAHPEPAPRRREPHADPEEEQGAAPSGAIPELIYAAAAEFGLDGAYLLAVADCESGLDATASSALGYYGLFQFDRQTWAAYGYGSIYDPAAQARTAARLLAAGQTSRWPNCT